MREAVVRIEDELRFVGVQHEARIEIRVARSLRRR